MKKCPDCGLEVPPHVPKCPRDGTPLGPPPENSPSAEPAPAPQSSSPPPTDPAPLRGPSPELLVEPDTPKESSIRAWIGVLIASLVLLGAYSVLRERLNPSPEASEPEVEEDETAAKASKGKKRRAAKRRGRGSTEEFEASSNDDFVVDDRVFGDLIAEGKAERAAAESAAVIEEPPPFVPPPEMYQPDGPYNPVASYREPGARDDVVTLDLSTGGDSGGPLSESAVKKVLRVSALMPCYDPVVQKVPQMRGRVDMRFVVAPDGHVMEATVTDSDLRSRTVEKCIVNRAKRFRFPSTTQKTRFSTHFDFSSR